VVAADARLGAGALPQIARTPSHRQQIGQTTWAVA